MIVLGLAGNGFVLYATVRYNAIELDRASVMYLQVIPTPFSFYFLLFAYWKRIHWAFNIISFIWKLFFSQNLAVADILILTFFFLPVLIVLISRRWIIGETLCFFTFSITSIAGFVDNFTILGISCHRVWVLLCPFRFVTSSLQARYKFVTSSLQVR